MITNEHFLDDDGAGNIRVYYLSGTTRIYTILLMVQLIIQLEK